MFINYYEKKISKCKTPHFSPIHKASEVVHIFVYLVLKSAFYVVKCKLNILQIFSLRLPVTQYGAHTVHVSTKY